MKPKQRAALDCIKRVLAQVGFGARYMTDQTAICLLALGDTGKGRKELLPGKKVLRDGARVRNILDFARLDLGREVAENTRESYRKESLKPLIRSGIVACFKTSVNDPNTHYKTDSEFQRILDETDAAHRAALIKQWKSGHTARSAAVASRASVGAVSVTFDSQAITMSPGAHNDLIKAVVESLAPAFVGQFSVLYIGDTANKMLYVDTAKLLTLKIGLSVHDKLPDVILLSAVTKAIIVVESVTSVGPISDARRDEIAQILEKDGPLTNDLVLITAFPNRATFRKFVSAIAWETYVWIADEGSGIIHFDTLV